MNLAEPAVNLTAGGLKHAVHFAWLLYLQALSRVRLGHV